MRVLVVLQTGSVRERVPVLTDREFWTHGVDVFTGELSTVPFGEIETHAAETDVVSQPLEPLGQIFPYWRWLV